MTQRGALLASTLLVVIAILSLGSITHAQGGCQWDNQGNWECTWDDGGSTSSDANDDDEAWWSKPGVDVALGAVGLIGSVAGGTYATLKVRRRRQALREMLGRIERTYSEHKARPDEGLPELAGLRERVHELHQSGGLSDSQFLELDNRAAERIAKLRLLAVDRRFRSLPDELRVEIDHVVSDGTVSPRDVTHIEERATAAGVTDSTRKELADLLGTWADEDDRLLDG